MSDRQNCIPLSTTLALSAIPLSKDTEPTVVLRNQPQKTILFRRFLIYRSQEMLTCQSCFITLVYVWKIANVAFRNSFFVFFWLKIKTKHHAQANP